MVVVKGLRALPQSVVAEGVSALSLQRSRPPGRGRGHVCPLVVAQGPVPAPRSGGRSPITRVTSSQSSGGTPRSRQPSAVRRLFHSGRGELMEIPGGFPQTAPGFPSPRPSSTLTADACLLSTCLTSVMRAGFPNVRAPGQASIGVSTRNFMDSLSLCHIGALIRSSRCGSASKCGASRALSSRISWYLRCRRMSTSISLAVNASGRRSARDVHIVLSHCGRILPRVNRENSDPSFRSLGDSPSRATSQNSASSWILI